MYFLLVYAKISLWHCGGVVTQRSAKPCTPVQFRSVPPIYRSRCGEFSRKSHDFGSIISLSPNGGIGIRVRLKIEWRNPYGFKSHFGHQQDDLKKRGHCLFKNILCPLVKIWNNQKKRLSAILFETSPIQQITHLESIAITTPIRWTNHLFRYYITLIRKCKQKLL